MIDHVKQANVASYMSILAELNADLKTNNGNKLTQLCFEHNVHYLVHAPKKIITTFQIILDQILTNAPKFVSHESFLRPLSANDHCTVSAMVTLKIRRNAAYLRHVWLYKQANIDHFRAGLLDADFYEVFALGNIGDICL